MLAAGDWVVRTVIWMRDGPKDEIGLVHEVRPSEREMKAGARVKQTTRLGCSGVVLGHVQTLCHARDARACVEDLAIFWRERESQLGGAATFGGVGEEAPLSVEATVGAPSAPGLRWRQPVAPQLQPLV